MTRLSDHGMPEGPDRPRLPGASGGIDPDRRGLYGISVTAELTGVAPQNLRVYEARGLIDPARTEGGTRRYSEHDIERIGRIAGLLGEGLNLRGIGHVLALEAETRRLRAEVAELRRRLRGSDRGSDPGSDRGSDRGRSRSAE